MKIENLGGQSSATPSAPSTAQSARERAISRLMGNSSSSPSAVPNQNSVSPEEMGAIAAPKVEKSEFEKVTEEAQKHSIEAESSPEPKAETKADEEPLSSQYAILARKEKAIRQREQQLKAREAAIKAQEETSKVSAPIAAPSIDESKYISREKLTSDPFGVLTELGMTYDQLTEAALNGPKPKEVELMNEIKAMREELKILKGETESTKKTFSEQQDSAYKQAVAQIRNEVRVLVDKDPNFETIKETGSSGDVVELIEQTFKEDGILLTVEEAAQQVEDYLLEEAMKLAKIKKIQQRLMPKAEAPKAEVKTENKQSQPLKTLTNAVGTSRQLSARERAILAMEGKLKQ